MQDPPRHVLVAAATKSTLAILAGLAVGFLAAAIRPAWSQAPAAAPMTAAPSEYKAMTTCRLPPAGVGDQRQLENSIGRIATEQGRSGWRLADATAYETPSGLCVLLIFRRP
ncbi:MAG: hypothetical protein ACRDGN_07640 [bacterium]